MEPSLGSSETLFSLDSPRIFYHTTKSESETSRTMCVPIEFAPCLNMLPSMYLKQIETYLLIVSN